ncbi:hypothetical protein BDV28DRAFT_148419 [Aspergillus coremiiformis]|uniref:Uncharacterized protein n=1 Tax=Aspergillus coremiiformis TaxID=138285 RepID=A0A5N6ZAF6_9EURO|nr:hypothetical protein BDV28DRAFT_148419 [Aspergillus coremiiformis]
MLQLTKTCIVSNQPTARLKNFRVIPFGADFHTREVEHVIRQVSRSFLTVRSDTCIVELPEVREVGSIAWQLWRENDIGTVGAIHISKHWHLTEILNALWPLGGELEKLPVAREEFSFTGGSSYLAHGSIVMTALAQTIITQLPQRRFMPRHPINTKLLQFMVCNRISTEG